MTFTGGRYSYAPGTEGPLADWWVYEDLKIPHTRLSACAGFPPEEVQVVPMTYDEMRPGCYEVNARLEDMDINHVEASLCFPTFPRFCGQTFLEAKDRDLALLCVQAYNDWLVEEWCVGSGGRLIPLCLVPLIPEPPSTYYWGRVFGCFFDDQAGLDALEQIGADQVTFEVDYPHADGTWPHTLTVAEEQFGHLDDDLIYKLARGNTIRMLGLDLD